MGYEARGLYIEDFEDDKIYTSQARTITETDVMNFAGLTGDFNPLHTDEEFAKEGPFKARVAHGMLGGAIMTGMSNQLGIFEGTTIAFLELTQKYVAPLFIGATVHLELKIKEKRMSSKPGRGIITFFANLIDSEGKHITEAEWVITMQARS